MLCRLCLLYPFAAAQRFLEKNNGDTESYIKNCEMSNNIIRFSGYGWGQQRHNTYTPAAIKGWSYENTAYNYTVHDNIFDRAAYRMLHLVAKKKESCPLMYKNTYINKLGQTLGQYGSNEVEEPAIHSYDERVEEIITNIFGDKDWKVYFMDLKRGSGRLKITLFQWIWSIPLCCQVLSVK